jgi:2'-phosphotransferase
MTSEQVSQKSLEQMSRRLTKILRHSAKSMGLPIRSDGYVAVDDLFKVSQFQSFSLHDIQTIVKTDAKQRYNLIQEPEKGCWLIRANQGHSITDLKVEMDEIKDASEIPHAIHGTTQKAFEQIIKSQGLSRMKRQHIHFVPGLPEDQAIISGFRKDSQILIYVDVQKAIQGMSYFTASFAKYLMKKLKPELNFIGLPIMSF